MKVKFHKHKMSAMTEFLITLRKLSILKDNIRVDSTVHNIDGKGMYMKLEAFNGIQRIKTKENT